MADTTEKTIADELREAAARLRANPERAVDEPLASWLEQTADDYATETDDIECPNCGDGVCRHPAEGVFCAICEDPAPCRCVEHALAVARVPNGTAQEVAAR